MIYGELICFNSSISFITSVTCILYFCCAIFKSTNLTASRMSVLGIEHCYTTPKLPSPNFFSIKYLPAIMLELLDLGLKYFNSSAIDMRELFDFLLLSVDSFSLVSFFPSNLMSHLRILYCMVESGDWFFFVSSSAVQASLASLIDLVVLIDLINYLWTIESSILIELLSIDLSSLIIYCSISLRSIILFIVERIFNESSLRGPSKFSVKFDLFNS